MQNRYEMTWQSLALWLGGVLLLILAVINFVTNSILLGVQGTISHAGILAFEALYLGGGLACIFFARRIDKQARH
jgi:uncharacterized integral membrane protein